MVAASHGKAMLRSGAKGFGVHAAITLDKGTQLLDEAPMMVGMLPNSLRCVNCFSRLQASHQSADPCGASPSVYEAPLASPPSSDSHASHPPLGGFCGPGCHSQWLHTFPVAPVDPGWVPFHSYLKTRSASVARMCLVVAQYFWASACSKQPPADPTCFLGGTSGTCAPFHELWRPYLLLMHCLQAWQSPQLSFEAFLAVHTRVVCNGFTAEVSDEGWPRDAVLLFRHASMWNHSCAPNCKMAFGPQGGTCILTTTGIQAGEECTISYIPDSSLAELPLSERQKTLQQMYGFLCSCLRCVQEANTNQAAPFPQIAASSQQHRASLFKGLAQRAQHCSREQQYKVFNAIIQDAQHVSPANSQSWSAEALAAFKSVLGEDFGD